MSDLLVATRHPVTPKEVAALYHRHPNTLGKHLRDAGLPPVNQLVIWARLFNAGHLLEDPGRSVDNVAATLAFPSPSALCNQLRRYVGASPGDIRSRGGLDVMVAAFRRRTSVEESPAEDSSNSGGCVA